MNAWLFVTAAYVVTVGGTAGLICWAWTTMRAAERHVERLTRRP